MKKRLSAVICIVLCALFFVPNIVNAKIVEENCYSNYYTLLDTKENSIRAYNWISVPHSVVLCDVYGNAIPELLYFDYVENDFHTASFHIVTYEQGRTRELYLNEYWNSDVGGTSQDYLFQISGDKRLYYARRFAAYSYVQWRYSVLDEETDSFVELYSRIDSFNEETGTRTTTCRKNGQNISVNEYEVFVKEIESKTISILWHSGNLHNGFEFAEEFVAQNGCKAVDYYDAQNRLFYLSLVGPGWYDTDSGRKYLNVDGSWAEDEWKKIYNQWYYFNAGGIMMTGWQKIEGKWYYLGTSGAMQTGWAQVSGKWYYLDASGAMQTGWQKISGKWYYLDASGAMQTGWQKIANVWYYFNAGGDMTTGWRTINNKTYYFKENGAMAAREWCKGYWLNSDGTWTYKYKASWKQDSKGWWYGDESGWYAKSETIKIDGKNYTFDANGYMK